MSVRILHQHLTMQCLQDVAAVCMLSTVWTSSLQLKAMVYEVAAYITVGRALLTACLCASLVKAYYI